MKDGLLTEPLNSTAGLLQVLKLTLEVSQRSAKVRNTFSKPPSTKDNQQEQYPV